MIHDWNDPPLTVESWASELLTLAAESWWIHISNELRNEMEARVAGLFGAVGHRMFMAAIPLIEAGNIANLLNVRGRPPAPLQVTYTYYVNRDLCVEVVSPDEPEVDPGSQVEGHAIAFDYIGEDISDIVDWEWTLDGQVVGRTARVSVRAPDQESYLLARATAPQNSNVYGIGSVSLRPREAPNPTLYLIDTSGSMEGHKIRHAVSSARTSVESIETQHEGTSTRPEVAVLSFAGECSPSSTQERLGFTTDLEQAKSLFSHSWGVGGGTPSPQALSVATERMQRQLEQSSATRGRIIVLSDGQSTCGPIRPADVYSRHMGTSSSNALPFTSGLVAPSSAPPPIQYLTVGFDIPPGSAVERDLQYLAASTGGRYFNAQDERQLTQAFRKLARVYSPKALPGSAAGDETARDRFQRGRSAILTNDFITARAAYEPFVQTYPNEPAGAYNLALALEGHDRYLGAVEQYRRYLRLAPEADDAAAVQAQIPVLEQDAIDHRAYLEALVQSDLAYLQAYYDQLFNRSNSALSAEFGGFVIEKGPFYADLADALETDDPAVVRASQDLARSFERVARRVGTPTFDRDAVSLLTLPIAQLEEIVSLLGGRE